MLVVSVAAYKWIENQFYRDNILVSRTCTESNEELILDSL